MTQFHMTLPDVVQAVTRPVVYAIIEQVQKITGIKKDTKIYFPGDIETMRTAGTTIDDKDDRFAVFESSSIMFIEVEEEFNQDNIASTVIGRNENMKAFYDPALGASLTPVYASTDVTINFKYRSNSKNEVVRWRDDIRNRVSQMRDINLHVVKYHYGIPSEILGLIYELYTKRENYLGYDQTFAEYVTSHSSPRLTVIGDLAGGSNALAVSESQRDIIGMFGFDTTPDKPERDDQSGTWTISFPYKFTYDRPTGVNVSYPIMVHNQLINKIYTDHLEKGYDLNPPEKTYTKSLGALSYFAVNASADRNMDPKYVLTIPSFDDYVLRNEPDGTGTYMTVLAEVDTSDKKTMFNLRELGDIVIDEDIMEFIAGGEYQYMVKPYESILNISLYREGNLARHDAAFITPTLDFKANDVLDLRKQHRARFSIVTNLSMMSVDAFGRLAKYPKALKKIIGAINELLRNHPGFNNLGLNGPITRIELTRLYEVLTGFSLNSGVGVKHYYGDVGFKQGKGLFGDLDPAMVEYYRNNSVRRNTVMITGLIALART